MITFKKEIQQNSDVVTAMTMAKGDFAEFRTLLTLLFWATHTLEGRNFIIENAADTQVSRDNIRKLLTDPHPDGYAFTDEKLISAITEAHFTALSWEVEWGKNVAAGTGLPDAGKMAQLEINYSEHMACIFQQLMHDFKNHEFSLNW